MTTINSRIAALDWALLSESLDTRGYALTPPLLGPDECAELSACYDDAPRFRSTVIMARHGFGRGQYKYFSYPLPPVVETLRERLYPGLATIANDWERRLGSDREWPLAHAQLRAQCLAACRT